MKNTPTVFNRTLKYPAIIIMSFLFSGVSLFGDTAPFCAAFIGSLSGFGCILAFTASAVGMILKSDAVSIIPTLITLIIIGAFRLVYGSKKSPVSELTSAVFTGVAVLVSGVVTADVPSRFLTGLAFAVIAGVCSYSLVQCYKVICMSRHFSALGMVNTAMAGILGVFFITALTSYEIGVINLGVITAAYLTLGFSEKYGFAGGAVCAVISALGVAISDERYVYTALVFCSAGVASALFKNMGRLPQASGFILSSGICFAFLGVENFPAGAAFGVVLGCAVFYIAAPDKLTELFNRKPIIRNNADISEIYAERLRLIGLAMGDVKLAVLKTAETLDKKSHYNHAWVYNSACDNICGKCKNNMKCWGQDYGDTVREMERLVALMRTGRQLTAEDLPLGIAVCCHKKDSLAGALNKQYREFTAAKSAARKLCEMREILTAQLSATEKMLETMAEDFTSSMEYDKDLGAKTEEILEANGIIGAKAVILVNNERLSIEAYGKGKLTCTKEKLCDQISLALRHEFDLPSIITDGNKLKLTMYERTVYSIEYGSYQYSKGTDKGQSCGDYFDSFIDGRGHAYVILSDGMGSGGRARVDSAFACGMLVKLLQTGVSLGSAIGIINNSLLVKSTDESFATLDICEIDLYTGKVTLYKAGSAPTYIKCNKQIVKAQGRGLPIGMSSNPQYEFQSFTIGNSDVVIMTSDGAELSERWLEHELNKTEARTLSMEGVAETVASAAKFAAERGREDDISVIAIKLVK